MNVDYEWALQKLDNFINLTKLIWPPSTSGITYVGDNRRPSGNADDIIAQAQIVEKILDRILPRWRTEIPTDKKRRWQQHHQAAIRAVSEIQHQAEVAEKLGDNAPTLDASTMHPWAWEGARSLWQSGHFREAVAAALRKINAETQNKIGRRDVSETDLFMQAFSDNDPKPKQPRLRLTPDDDSQTSRSVLRGARCIAEGLFAAVRNPSSHEDLEEIPETIALEQLAAVSLLARMVDDAQVVRAE